MADAPELEALLSAMLEAAGMEAPTPAAVSQLADLARLTETWGGRMNLSGHRSARGICEALIGDAIGLVGVVERAIERPLTGRVVDLGSGAGYPGLPIAILRPDADVHLVEVREKRHFFQRAAIRRLGLPNATAVRARIEDLASGRAAIVVAQAVGPIDEVIDLMRPYLEPGAYAVIPGGAELESPASGRDLRPRIIDYRSPGLGQPRRLWIGRSRTS